MRESCLLHPHSAVGQNFAVMLELGSNRFPEMVIEEAFSWRDPSTFLHPTWIFSPIVPVRTRTQSFLSHSSHSSGWYTSESCITTVAKFGRWSLGYCPILQVYWTIAWGHDHSVFFWLQISGEIQKSTTNPIKWFIIHAVLGVPRSSSVKQKKQNLPLWGKRD